MNKHIEILKSFLITVGLFLAALIVVVIPVHFLMAGLVFGASWALVYKTRKGN